VRYFVQRSIAPSTAATYAAPIARYQSWCSRVGRNATPAGVTAASLASFIAAAALSEHGIAGATFRTWRSAISNWREMHLVEGPPLGENALLSRTIEGVVRDRRAVDAAARAARPETAEVTVDLLAHLEPIASGWPGGTPTARMEWAALAHGTYALARPNEFLRVGRGSPGLCTNQISFYNEQGLRRLDWTWTLPARCAAGALPADNDPTWWAVVPHSYEVALGPTKADPKGSNAPLRIGAPIAVTAMWRWLHTRRELIDAQPDAPPGVDAFAGEIFCFGPGRKPLSCAQLCNSLSWWICAVTGGMRPKVTGKTFRRGGTNSLLTHGATLEEAMTAGRWLGKGMPVLYSSKKAQARRAIAASIRLGAAAAAAASAPSGAHGPAGPTAPADRGDGPKRL
jgi:hypothetical protein